jgi:hypothetical protein
LTQVMPGIAGVATACPGVVPVALSAGPDGGGRGVAGEQAATTIMTSAANANRRETWLGNTAPVSGSVARPRNRAASVRSLGG